MDVERRGAMAVGLALLAGCSTGGTTANPSSIATLPASSSTASTAPSPSPPRESPGQSSGSATAATPARVLAALQNAGLPVALVMNYDETSDPNKLLGRPSGYEAKNAFADSRLVPDAVVPKDAIAHGGSVEVFSTADGAQKRAAYIRAIGAPLANEYDYVAGRVLVRVTGELPPTQAKGYETAVSLLQLE